MLTAEQNERLVRSGPGTPMGELLRRYWMPAFLLSELPGPDCSPVRVKLLGEDLVGFRDSDGRLGLLDEFCAHRTASLFFGRNEECGLRCSYHGWKYDVDGNCVDMPSEPQESNFKDRVRLRAYRLEERGGVIWAYLGPSELEPSLPEFEWAMLPDDQRYVTKRIQECNWVQALEGGIDSSHVSFTHRYNLDNAPMHAGSEGIAYIKGDTRPRFEVAESDFGLLVGARRNVDEHSYYWRLTPFIMPWYTIIPPFGTHNPVGAHAWVPIDDLNCWTWSVNYHPTRPLAAAELESMRAGDGIHVEYVPGTFRPVANMANDFLVDRDAQRARLSFSGVKGISMQDASLQESMGRVVNRARERLGTSDAAIILARRRLLQATDALDDDSPLPGIAVEHHRVRSASLVLPRGTDFQEGSRDAVAVAAGANFVSI